MCLSSCVLCLATTIAAFCVTGVPGSALADERSAHFRFTRIRTAEAAVLELLQSGYDRSPTFRQLLGDLESSQWLVFVQPGRCPSKEMVGCLLHFVGRLDGSPYVRIIVNRLGQHPDRVISILAHELQHAREVTQDPTVVDVPTLRAMFKRIGHERMRTVSAQLYETAAARKMGETVLKELSVNEGVKIARRSPDE